MLDVIKTAPINELVDALPQQSVTVYMLRGLDFVIPGEWQNLTGFKNTIRTVTGEQDSARIEAIAQRAQQLYADQSQGYQRAMWLYQKVDIADTVLAAAAMANKVGDTIGFLSFLSNLTPKPDIVQSIDLGLKIVVEMLAYGFINGLPRDGFAQFTQSLSNYAANSKMRMATLVCVDGVIPLGSDFIDKAGSIIGQAQPGDLEGNAIYQQIGNFIPGNSAGERLGFIQQAFGSVQSWMRDFQNTHNLTPQVILGQLKSVINIADDKLDYVGAFLDATTIYYTHTGTQSVARQLVLKANTDVPNPLPRPKVENKPKPRDTGRSDSTPASKRELHNGRRRLERDDTSSVIAALDKDVATYLDNLGISYETGEEAGYFFFPAASTLIEITTYAWDDFPKTTVAVMAPVAADIQDLSKKGGLYLLEENYSLLLSKFSYLKEQETIYLTYSLFGDMFTEENFAAVIDSIALNADDYDKDVAAMTEGITAKEKYDYKKQKYHPVSRFKSKLSVADLWDEIEGCLDDLDFDYEEDGESYIVQMGSSDVYIETYEDENTERVVVDISALIVTDLDRLPKNAVLEFLALNWEMPLGGFIFDSDDDAIYYNYQILGETLTPALLEVLITFLGTFADEIDNDVVKQLGGKRAKD